MRARAAGTYGRSTADGRVAASPRTPATAGTRRPPGRPRCRLSHGPLCTPADRLCRVCPFTPPWGNLSPSTSRFSDEGRHALCGDASYHMAPGRGSACARATGPCTLPPGRPRRRLQRLAPGGTTGVKPGRTEGNRHVRRHNRSVGSRPRGLPPRPPLTPTARGGRPAGGCRGARRGGSGHRVGLGAVRLQLRHRRRQRQYLGMGGLLGQRDVQSPPELHLRTEQDLRGDHRQRRPDTHRCPVSAGHHHP